MELKINPLFQDGIPPLTELEFQQLEANILKEGRIINPLITWNGYIVDGHNRFRILQAHPELPYETYEKEFSGIPSILAWICKNQLGRRNLTPAQRKYLIGKQYESEKAAYGGQRETKRDNSGKFTASSQNGNLRSAERTCTRIAEENNVSKNTVLRAESFSKAVDLAEGVSPGIRQEILSGSLRPTEKELTAVIKAAPQEQEAMVQGLRESHSSPKKSETIREVQKISDDMLRDRVRGSRDDVLCELTDALESMMFRWTFCLSHNSLIFRQKSCLEGIRKLTEKGTAFFKEIEGGHIPDDDRTV